MDGSEPTSSWSRDGDPLPHLSVTMEALEVVDDEKYATAEIFRGGVEVASADEREAAFVPVERIDAPLLLISGEDDRMWSAATFGRRIVDRLEAADVDFDYEHLAYENAGHAVSVPYGPTATKPLSTLYAMGGTPAGDAEAMADSWPRVLDTLDDALA